MQEDLDSVLQNNKPNEEDMASEVWSPGVWSYCLLVSIIHSVSLSVPFWHSFICSARSLLTAERGTENGNMS